MKVSPAIEASLGLNAGELCTKVDDFIKHLHPADRERFRMILWSIQERTWARIRTDFRMRHADNSYRWFELEAASVPNADARAMRCVGLVRDVTDAKRAHERLLHDAVHDSLTGLPNRELVLDRLGVAASCAPSSENGVRPSVVFIDIDKFKSVNVSFGLVVGDSLLLTVARRLQSHLGQHDTLARVGGDQFAILLVSEQSPQDLAGTRRARAPVAARADQDRRAGDRADGLDRHRRFYDGETPSHLDLYKEAEIAMYRAKRGGADRIEIFRPEMRSDRDDRVALESDLRKALAKNQIKVLYQPIIYLPTEELAGFEALVRWEHPKRGLMSPVDFIPIAEQSDLIVRLGSHVLLRAAHEAARWQRELPREERPAVRLRQHLEPADLPPEPHPGDPPHPRAQHRAQGLAAAGDHREPGDGESRAGDRDPRVAARRRRRARARRLRHRLFVARLSAALSRSTRSRSTARWCRRAATAAAAGSAIVRSIVALGARARQEASSPKASRAAEDVAFLRSINCQYAQGFYYGEPMSDRDVLQLLKMVRTAEHKLRPRGLFRAKAKGKQTAQESGRGARHAAAGTNGNGSERRPVGVRSPPALGASILPNSTVRPRHVAR